MRAAEYRLPDSDLNDDSPYSRSRSKSQAANTGRSDREKRCREADSHPLVSYLRANA